MASVFGHAITAFTGWTLLVPKEEKLKTLLLSVFCSILPDADIIMFNFGYPYEHWLGHRGFTHSIFFGILLGILVVLVFYKLKIASRRGVILVTFFSLITISHGILDAMTTGGRGVAFFAPFDNERYFLPWRFIQVSPIGADRFFSQWGLEVLKSEAVFIGLPCLAIILISKFIQNRV